MNNPSSTLSQWAESKSRVAMVFVRSIDGGSPKALLIVRFGVLKRASEEVLTVTWDSGEFSLWILGAEIDAVAELPPKFLRSGIPPFGAGFRITVSTAESCLVFKLSGSESKK
jgi:hypothetical protein